MTILCVTGYEKGHEFLRELKRQGCTVVLLIGASLKDKARWPIESIDEIFFMPDDAGEWNREDTIRAVSFLARTREFARIVALDDLDVELAAALREHLRVPGMGDSLARKFRDKLTMRMEAREASIDVPEFVPILNYERIHRFLETVPGPWLLKPRSMAGAIGIKKIHRGEELWPLLDALGDLQSHYLLERFVTGDVFHVDSIVHGGQVRFAIASGYGRPPMEVSHEGGIFTSGILDRNSDDARRLLEINRRVLGKFGLDRGVSHTEFLKSGDDGRMLFLETSARVGGAHIVELVEAATGINLWSEWAKLEIAGGGNPYSPPEPRQDYAGLLVSLARQEYPDTSAYNDPEVVWRMDRDHHVGLIVRSARIERVRELVDAYAQRFRGDFFASLPPKDKPGN